MLFDPPSFLARQRRLASRLGLALLVFSPLFFLRPLEDAYILPQRLLALLGLSLAFAGLPSQSFSRSRVLWAGLLYFTWRLLSHSRPGAGPAVAGLSLPWVVEQMAPLGILLLVAHGARDSRWAERLWYWTGLCALLVAVYALIQLWGLDPWDQGAMDMGFLKRAHGSLGNPDFLAGFLILTLPAFALAWCQASSPKAPRLASWGHLIACGLIGGTLLLTQVRGAWLAASMSVPLTLAMGYRELNWKRVWVLAGTIGALCLLVSLPGRLNPSGQAPWSRLHQGISGDGSWAGRRFMAKVGWNLTLREPLLGVGPGHFQTAYLEEQGRLLNQASYSAEPYRFTADIHNDWLQSLAESGWIGLGLLLWVFICAWKVAKQSGTKEGVAILGLISAFAIQALFHFPFSIQASALLFWGAVGLCAAWDSPQTKKDDSERLDWAWLILPFSLGLIVTGRQAVASAALNSGTVLREVGRNADAIPVLERAAKLWPEDARIWVRLGLAQDAVGSTEAAVQSFEQAVRALPGESEAWTNLGLALGKLNQYPAAQAASEQALALNPRAPEAWSNLAKLRYLQGDPTGATRDLESGLAQAGPSALLYFNLGAVALNQGHRAEARAAFEACLRLQPTHAEAQRLLQSLRHVP